MNLCGLQCVLLQGVLNVFSLSSILVYLFGSSAIVFIFGYLIIIKGLFLPTCVDVECPTFSNCGGS